MQYTNQDRYLETEVLSADPIKLVGMLYRAAIEATGAARRHLEAGAIRERSRQVMKAWEIIGELSHSLDHVQGGEISRSLSGLYAYLQVQLLEANGRQTDAPLAEVEQLLTTLQEAWATLSIASEPREGHEPVSCVA
jgi:flagellar secretion chaperone FliS